MRIKCQNLGKRSLVVNYEAGQIGGALIELSSKKNLPSSCSRA